MQFWPLGIVILGSVSLTLTMIVFMIVRHKPSNRSGRSPHGRWNRQTDLIIAREHAEQIRAALETDKAAVSTA